MKIFQNEGSTILINAGDLRKLTIQFFQVLSASFAVQSPAVDLEKLKQVDWLGSLNISDIWQWSDTMALLVLGG